MKSLSISWQVCNKCLYTLNTSLRVNQPVTQYWLDLRAGLHCFWCPKQNLNPSSLRIWHINNHRKWRGGLSCFWCPNKTWTPPLHTFDTLIMVENELEMRKLLPPPVKGSKIPKQKPSNIIKACSQSPKISLYVALLLLEFKN
jgi:hypothetical protein